MPTPTVPMEDELGDVLEKAMRRAGLNEEALARRTGVPEGRILDAINYRPELSGAELCRLAGALGLNEIGLCALGCGRYPLPELAPLPYIVHPLRMSYGIGVANAYIVSAAGESSGVLFDTGPDIVSLEAAWPLGIRSIEAVYLTHIEGEHVGGLCAVVSRFGLVSACCPVGAGAPCSVEIGEGERKLFGTFSVSAFSTPGHTSSHNCYLVQPLPPRAGPPVLIAGDLLFAGSIGCAHFSQQELASNLGRMLREIPPETIIAPGHGPMTTAENELRYNPFIL